jgi:hypothetical protein
MRPGVGTLFMSAHDKNKLIEQERISTRDKVLKKPFGEGELLLCVREALDARVRRRHPA